MYIKDMIFSGDQQRITLSAAMNMFRCFLGLLVLVGGTLASSSNNGFSDSIGKFLEMGYANSWSTFFNIFPCWQADGSVEGLCRHCYQEALRAFEKGKYTFNTQDMVAKNKHRRISIDAHSIGRQNDSFASYCNKTNPNFALVYDTQEPFTEWETKLYTPFYLMTDYWYNMTKHKPIQGLPRFVEFSMVLLDYERNAGETLIPLASKSSTKVRQRKAVPLAPIIWGAGAGLVCIFTKCLYRLIRFFRWLG